MENVIKGVVPQDNKQSFNEVIISYGPTGSGKTYTMVIITFLILSIFKPFLNFHILKTVRKWVVSWSAAESFFRLILQT